MNDMKCQFISELVNSGLVLEDVLSHMEMIRVHIKSCSDCQEAQEWELRLKDILEINK